MTTAKLTTRRRRYLEVVDTLTRQKGWAPSYQEVATVLGVYPSAVGMMLRPMEEMGLLTHIPGVMRTLKLTEAGKSALAGQEKTIERIPVLTLKWREE